MEPLNNTFGIQAETPESLSVIRKRQLNEGFIDIDPCLKTLKGGHLMKQTFHNYSKSTMHGASQTMRFSPKSRRTINGGESTTDFGSISKMNRLTGTVTGNQGLNYQNVDLFKIPDIIQGKKQRKQRRHRLSMIENHKTLTTLNFDKNSIRDNQSEQRTIFTDNPDQLIREAINEVRLNQKFKQSFVDAKLNLKDTAANSMDQKFDTFRAQTEIQTPSRSPMFQDPPPIQINSPTMDDQLRSHRPSETGSGPLAQFQPNQFSTLIGFGSGNLDKQNHISNAYSTQHTKSNHQNLNEKSQSVFKKGESTMEFALDDIDMKRRTPILHMQFDELASHQLNGTYASKFYKNEPLQRRNPLKYMNNPTKVFGLTKGTLQYTFKEGAKNSPIGFGGTYCQSFEPRSTQYSTIQDMSNEKSGRTFRNSSPLRTFQSTGYVNNGPFGIKVHSLALQQRQETEVLDPVVQISGKGASVSPPIDRPYVINNVIKPFKASSEVDRQRATQILDYIIMRRKMAARRKDEVHGERKQDENGQLLGQIEQEKIEKQLATRRLSGEISVTDDDHVPSEMDEFQKNNKYGSVLQKDLDKITGGMQTVQECHLDLDSLEKLVGTPVEGDRPTQGKMKFLVEQLQVNDFFKEFVENVDGKFQKLISEQPGIQKYNYKDKIQETLLEMSPVRQARKEVQNLKKKQKPLLTTKNMPLMEVDLLNESFDRTLMEPTKINKKFKTDVSKDQFSHLNKKNMEKSSDQKQVRADRMKQYGRWLLYNGVDHLPPEKVLAHNVPKKSPKKRLSSEIDLSPQPTFFKEAIEEQNEGSKQTTLSED